MLPSERISGQKSKEVFGLILRRGVLSKLDLKERTGLTVSTLTRILDELVSGGFIVEVGFGESTGGRRPILYRANPDFSYVFGLDISRFTSKLVLCDLHLNILDEVSWEMDATMGPHRLIDAAVTAIHTMMKQQSIRSEQVLGLGIGAVGPLDRSKGIILNPQHFASSEWLNVPVCDIFKARLGFYVTLDNGANSAILGEYWSAQDEQLEHLLYLHVGVGIRSAMIVGGELVYGAVDMEGAVGQMVIQYDGLPSRQASGNYGAWESYVSTYAMEQKVKAQLKAGRNSILNQYANHIDAITYSSIEQALASDDAMVKELFLQSSCYLGIGLANMLNILHPQKVIMGGPLIANNKLYYENAIEVALQKTYHAPTYHVEFEKSRLGEDAVAIGAVVTVIKQMMM